MTVDRSIYEAPQGLELPDAPLTVEIAEEDPMEDGSVEVFLGPQPKEDTGELAHDVNLAEHMDDDQLNILATDLMADIDEDKRSREDWEKTYKDGLRLLGLTIERRTEPWDGACGVVHPILAEAVVRFQSELITETFPAAGPVKTKVLGRVTKEKEEAAARVREDLNIELTDRMTEYRSEHERMLWNLPIAGSAFKKIYFDPTLQRQVAMFVAAEDLIAAYGASDLASCPRFTHVLKKTKNDVAKLMEAGFYKKVDLDEPINQTDEITDEKEKLSGQSALNETNYHTLYEVSVDIELPGYENGGIACPYVITIDRDSQRVLSIRRNWKEGDPLKLKKLHFVHYQYIPGFGFYGFGLIHLVGGFAEGATSLLRQLVDAGTLSNLPGGLKTRGLRIKGDDTPIGPGEWRDVDVPGGTLKENLLPLPYKEPSVVLAGLLDKIVEEGRKFAAIAEMKIQDFDSNSPVGTTMALLERTLKVMSAIQARIYDVMKHEFRMVKSLIDEFGTDVYDYEPETGDPGMKRADYASVDVMPVADPNAATMSQRIVQWQAVMQLSATAPQIYDLPELHGQMLDILGVKNVDKLIPQRRANLKPTDPVTENMAIMTGQPVKAHIIQDHDAHIAVHQAMMQDPMLQQVIGQNPMAQQIMGAMMAHIMEHTAFAYRNQMQQHLGAELPHPEETLPPEVEVQVSALIAHASQKLLTANQNVAQQAQAQKDAQDPVIQQQMAEVKVKEAEVQRKTLKDQADIQIAQDKLHLEGMKLQMEAQANDVDVNGQLAAQQQEMEMQREKHQMNMAAQAQQTQQKMMQADQNHQMSAMQKQQQQEIAASEAARKAEHDDQMREIQRKQAAAKPAAPTNKPKKAKK